ncbi:MAG: PH domain-containing protein [Verrucomicrobiales bacterium]
MRVPYHEGELLSLLQQGQLAKSDLVYYEGLGDWCPIEQVFVVHEEISGFANDGQDEETMIEVFNRTCDICAPDEQVFYIAIQNKRFTRKAPDAFVATNKRLLIVRQRHSTSEVEDYLWGRITSLRMKQSNGGSRFGFLYGDGSPQLVELDDIPDNQVVKLYQISQEMRGLAA